MWVLWSFRENDGELRGESEDRCRVALLYTMVELAVGCCRLASLQSGDSVSRRRLCAAEVPSLAVFRECERLIFLYDVHDHDGE